MKRLTRILNTVKEAWKEPVLKEKSRMDAWAENECIIACKKENPNFDFESEDDFDYGCSCYKSALKAYNSLCNDGHSGFSFGLTKNILNRLMNHLPLTPITEADFDGVKAQSWKPGQKTQQCPRMSALFRIEDENGNITYDDIDRSYFIDIDNGFTYVSGVEFLNEMFPITLPYYPRIEKYKIFAQTCLTDKKNGDFDTKGIFYMITPDGERIDLNIFMAEKDKKWVKISKKEYNERLKNRIDTHKQNDE